MCAPRNGNHKTEYVQINISVENVSITLGFKPESFPLSASLPQQTGRDEIQPPYRPIRFFYS